MVVVTVVMGRGVVAAVEFVTSGSVVAAGKLLLVGVVTNAVVTGVYVLAHIMPAAIWDS